MQPRFDFAIVGAGMAGASLAAQVAAAGAQVVLIEAENTAGYHATGRSAAFWTESYGGPGVLPLTVASGPALREGGYLVPRGALTIARAGDEAKLTAFADQFAELGVTIALLDRAGIAARVPGVRTGWVCGAYEPSCCDIDVARLHQDYLATARRRGVTVWTGAGLAGAERVDGGWTLSLADGRTLGATTLVNAAGAWADGVARLAGARPLGIQPYRRTVAQLRTTPGPPATLPLVLDLGGQFYFKPQAGRLWLSPHDETQTDPCDAAPDELDVATAIDRLDGVVDWTVERVEHRWAGLRSFAPDRLPVYGFAADVPGFFWFAGQGGFGIQTAPAAAMLGAALLGVGASPVDPAPYAPERFS